MWAARGAYPLRGRTYFAMERLDAGFDRIGTPRGSRNYRILALLQLRLRRLVQRFDVSHAVGPTGLPPGAHRGYVIRNQVAAKVYFDQRPHKLVHVGVAVIDVSFHEVGNRLGH